MAVVQMVMLEKEGVQTRHAVEIMHAVTSYSNKTAYTAERSQGPAVRSIAPPPRAKQTSMPAKSLAGSGSAGVGSILASASTRPKGC